MNREENPPIRLNCDLGEGEAPERTASLMASVHRVNVACGGHAGDRESMERCLRLARDHGVAVGAHPGLPGQHGRAPTRIEPAALTTLVLDQVGRLAGLARREGESLRHVKLHGSLYHAAEREDGLARALAETVASQFPGTALVGLPEGRVARAAKSAGLEFLAEGFLDRGYRPDGSLVPRGEPEDLLDPAVAVARLRHWIRSGTVRAVDGSSMALKVVTWCVHSDTAGAPEIAAACRVLLARSPGEHSDGAPA